MRILFISLFFLMLSASLVGQEYLLPLAYSKAGALVAKKSKTPLSLPFFDDFSYDSSQPDLLRWEYSGAFVNESFGLAPPSVGTVSFDALDAQGAIYPGIGYVSSFAADTLTSLCINLDGKTGVALSFWYQCGGIAPVPESDDSISLQFYAEASDRWVSVWNASGSSSIDFQKVFVRVEDSKFLNDKFQFRFVNYVTLGKDDNPALRGNNDVWNLDMVYLDANRTTETFVPADMCFTQNIPILLNNYQSIPWKHFQKSPSSTMQTTLPVGLRNYGASSKNIGELSYHFLDLWGNRPEVVIKAGSYDIPANSSFVKSFPFNGYVFSSSNADSALIEVATVMVLDETDFYEPNNRISRQHIFKDYYAYDDGVAETGYGISGNYSTNATVAYHFTNMAPAEPLWAVDMFFTRTLNKANLKYFYLVVWADNGGKPGEVLYRQPLAETLRYADGMGKFNTFRLHESINDQNDTSVVVGSSYYIGWEQISETMLGVGLDFNNVSNQNLYYNLGEGWVQSKFTGALMLRPVFSKRPKSVTTPTETIQKSDIIVFPNPASNWIRVKLPYDNETWQCKISNLSGAIFCTEQMSGTNWEVNIESLCAGFYIISCQDKKGRLILKKFVVAK
ncbi:MAG: hypothetical protein RIS47_695 [Bacteroidota bacterium]|jgi:hypothetical protein